MSTLPAGWIETGTSIEHSGRVLIQLAAVGVYGAEPLLVGDNVNGVWIGIETAPTSPDIDCGDWDSASTVSLYTRTTAEAFAARTVEDTVAGDCPQPYLSVEATRVVTGLRLAANVDVDTGDGTTRLRYRLWADELTVDGLTVGAKVIAIPHTGEFLTAPAILISHHSVPFVGFDPADLTNGVVLAGAAWNAESDPTMFDVYDLRGFEFGVGVGGQVWAYTSSPPLHYACDVDVRDAAGVAPPGIVAAGQALVANPGVEAVTHWRWSELSGAVPVAGILAGDWSSEGIDLAAGEELVPLRQILPKQPHLAPESWQPTTYEITSPLSVLLSANNFSGSGAVVLSGTGNQTWTVSGAATVTRILAATYDTADGYLTTKHVAGEDVWGWGLYAYLDVDLTAPGAGDVTLEIDWIAAGAVPVMATKTYTIPVAGAGTATYRIDLLFPAEGGPWYAERVDRMRFSGFVNGVYTLNSLELVAVEEAYVKLHARTPTYSGLVIAQDGSFAVGHWGDNPLIGAGPARQKDDESGMFSFGGPSDTAEGGAVRMDGTLEDTADEWHRMEGITTTYSATAIDADLTDGTNVIGTEDELTAVPLTYRAAWYHTLMSERAAANVAKELPASLYLDGGADICAAPAGTFVLPFRHTLGMVLEAQAEETGTGVRAGAGVPVYARRSLVGAPAPSDVLMATAVTDASGFVNVPIRTGTVSGSEMYVGLLGS